MPSTKTNRIKNHLMSCGSIWMFNILTSAQRVERHDALVSLRVARAVSVLTSIAVSYVQFLRISTCKLTAHRIKNKQNLVVCTVDEYECVCGWVFSRSVAVVILTDSFYPVIFSSAFLLLRGLGTQSE